MIPSHDVGHVSGLPVSLRAAVFFTVALKGETQGEREGENPYSRPPDQMKRGGIYPCVFPFPTFR